MDTNLNYRGNTLMYLQLLKEDSLRRIKQRMSNESDQLMDKKTNQTAGKLLDILFDPELITKLMPDQLIQVLTAIYPANILRGAWLGKYCDMLLRIIDMAKRNKVDQRAAAYEKNLREVRVPALKNSCQKKEILDNPAPLVDIYKITACLYRYYARNEQKFSFDADLQSMERLNKALQGVKAIGTPVLGVAGGAVSQEERQYALFLSWVLEEMLCKQDGLEEAAE